MSEYRLRALDKGQMRWPALHLLSACAVFALTYFAITHTIAK